MQKHRTQYVAKNAQISTKGWSLDFLTSSYPNFRAVTRVAASSSELASVIKDHERKGLPLVIEGLHTHESWNAKMFTIEGFQEHSNSSDITVRNVHSWTDKVMNFSDFVSQSRRVSPFAEEGETERLYGKDAECPHAWEKWLQESNVLPPSTLSHGNEDEFRFRPASSRIETLMCYLGIGDTYTPCHKDLCASSGQNLMCYTENSGSSFWFMTEGSSAPKASAYFHQLGQELDHENHVITLKQLGLAPFKVYVLEQRLGDLVLVPPRSCHQVVNYGGITLKTSWSRMTLKGLSTAYHHELPIYRRVGRPETYRIKSTIYYALTSRTKELEVQLRSQLSGSSGLSFTQELVNAINSSALSQTLKSFDPEVDRLAKDLVKLLSLYQLILAEEMPDAELNTRQQLDSSFDDESRIVCDFCECDIFQSFFECSQCTAPGSLVLCPGCYSEGRICRCGTMQPMQCRKLRTLIDTRDRAVDALKRYSGKTGGDIQLDNRREETTPGLFRAACLLFKARKDNRRTTRVCSKASNHYDSHEVPFVWGIHCVHCHRSACFLHILKHSKMHSAEALLLFDCDGKRIQYHLKHQQSGMRYGDNLLDVERSQEEGSPMDGFNLLAHITLQYGHCAPSNLKSLQHGWYDPGQEDGSRSNTSIPPVSGDVDQPRLTITIPAPRKRFPAKQTRGGKRKAFVDVPLAPYPIPRKRSRTSDLEAKPCEEVSESHEVLASPTRRPQTPPPSQRRTFEQDSDDTPSFKGSATLSTSPPVIMGKKAQHDAKPMQYEPLSPQKYLEVQASKRIGYAMKKLCPASDDDSPALILTPNTPNGRSANPDNPPQVEYPPARFVPPQPELALSASNLIDFLNDIAAPLGELNSTVVHHSLPTRIAPNKSK